MESLVTESSTTSSKTSSTTSSTNFPKKDLYDFIEEKKSNPVDPHRLMGIRFGILFNILNEMKRVIDLHEEDRDTGNLSPLSYLCSTIFLNTQDEPCKQEYRESSGGRRQSKCNIVFEIVNQLLHSDLYLFGEKKLFHTLNGPELERKLFIYATLDTELGISSAAAEASGENNEWRCSLFLNPNIITRPNGDNQLALNRGESMKWAESWMGNHTGLASWQQPEEKKVFGVDLGIINWGDDFLNHPLFDSTWDDTKKKIEMENILSILLLLEHELWHVAYGMYDPDENSKEEHELAKPSDIGFVADVFGSSFNNYENASEYIPPIGEDNDEKKTQLAFTDPHGHGITFSQLAYWGSGFRCQLAPFDMFEEIKIKKKKGKKGKKAHPQQHPTRIEMKKTGQGGRKKRRKKRTKRTRKRKSRTKRKNLKKGTKRKTRKKYRKKNYSKSSS